MNNKTGTADVPQRASRNEPNVLKHFLKLHLPLLAIILCWCSPPGQGQVITKKYKLPGFIQLNDSVFLSRTEMTIREYARFLIVWRKQAGDSSFLQQASPEPNYLGWIYQSPFDQSRIEYGDLYEIKENLTQTPRYTSLSYNAWLSDWPIVNVTRQQAELYCIFRTADYKIAYENEKKKKQQRLPVNLVFRLPTASEWIYAASAGLDTSNHKYGVTDDRPRSARPFSAAVFTDTIGARHPSPVTAGQLNDFKLLNMCGNVAELVQGSDFVFGGSFADQPGECTTTSRQLFTKPENNIGFRVAAVIRNR